MVSLMNKFSEKTNYKNLIKGRLVFIKNLVLKEDWSQYLH